MKYKTLSQKQAEIYKFIYDDRDTLICDGAVRSGKTVHMSIAFILWAMEFYDKELFGICGKTVRTTERNIINPILNTVSLNKMFNIKYTGSLNLMTITNGEKTNYFYIYGGKDESSYTLIQGITLMGVFFDEVALMPESFVSQAIARTITSQNRKLFFSCNPESPNHWFYTGWIKKTEEKKAKHLNFQLEDNPALTKEQIERTKTDYDGIFYDRYILGKWVIAEGLVYPMFNPQKHVVPTIERNYTQYQISIDYGTYNLFSAGLWGLYKGVWYRVKEYIHNGRKEAPKTPIEYLEDLKKFTKGIKVERIIVDPSASEFIMTVRRDGHFNVKKAINEVIDGIQNTATALRQEKIKINDCCKNALLEFGLYSWNEKANKDEVIKKNDHSMDEIRYFVQTNKLVTPERKSLLR